MRSVVGQQLSVLAARAIHERVLALLGGTIAPGAVLAAAPEDLRGAGLSWAKVAALRSLAEHVLDGRLQLRRFGELDDATVEAELVAVRGIGRWSAEMFMMFQLGRPDVLPVGDQGVRRAVERAYGLGGLPSPAELVALAEPWRPHRTAACLVLWRSLGNAPAPASATARPGRPEPGDPDGERTGVEDPPAAGPRPDAGRGSAP